MHMLANVDHRRLELNIAFLPLHENTVASFLRTLVRFMRLTRQNLNDVNGIHFLFGTDKWYFISNFQLTYLFHDSRFPFRKCRVATKLIVYVFHLNLNSSFGFLAI